jgi:hypothetical protein
MRTDLVSGGSPALAVIAVEPAWARLPFSVALDSAAVGRLPYIGNADAGGTDELL